MCSKIYYLNGNKNSELKIVEGSLLYNWFLNNHYIDSDMFGDNEQIVVSEQALNELKYSEEDFSDEENTLIGRLMFYFEYNQGYVFY